MASYNWPPIVGNNSFGSIVLNGATSGTLTLTVPLVVTSYSLVFPAAQGAAGSSLQNDGSGNLSWVSSAGISIGALDGQAENSNGLAIASDVLYAQSADATHPGMVNNTAQTFSGVKTFSSAPNLSSLTASQTVVTDASKNLASKAYTSLNTGSTIASRDSNGNMSANNFTVTTTSTISSGQTIGTSAGSAELQELTGSANASYVLPDATTLIQGWSYYFNNNATGTLSVYLHDGSTLLGTVSADGFALVICTLNTTTNGTWDIHAQFPHNTTSGSGGTSIPGTFTAASTVQGTQLISTVSTGTAPLVVTSTTQVANLNAATAGTVTTNANLTGPITSAGNATSIASQTGTGTTFAMSSGPTFTGTVTLPILSGSDTTDSSSSTTGAFTTAGGLGVAKKLYVGTTANVAGAINANNTAASQAIFSGWASGTASASNGSIDLGVTAAAKLIIWYDGAVTGNGFIDNTYDNAGALIRIRMRSAGTPVYPATFKADLTVTLPGLAGTGSRAVLSDTNGVLSAPVSDARLKKNVVELASQVNPIQAVNALKGVYFNWDTSNERVRYHGDQREIGMIAQDVEKVIPEAVQHDKDGWKSLDYSHLVPLLIEAVKAQQVEIDDLKRRNK